MSQYELEALIQKFNSIRHMYGIESVEQLKDLYTTNRPLFEVLYPMYMTLSYYCNT